MLLELIQNWSIMTNPYIEVTKMLITVLLSLSIGLLPAVDNYAHAGGFVVGILMGLMLMPSVSFGKWDDRRKRILGILAFPTVVALFTVGLWLFYAGISGAEFCPGCRYVNVGGRERGGGALPMLWGAWWADDLEETLPTSDQHVVPPTHTQCIPGLPWCSSKWDSINSLASLKLYNATCRQTGLTFIGYANGSMVAFKDAVYMGVKTSPPAWMLSNGTLLASEICKTVL
jgi:hypothetical protein